MKKDRQLLEKALDSILEDYSNDNKVIDAVVGELLKKGISRGRTTGIFTKAIPLVYVSKIELYLFSKYLYQFAQDYKISPEHYFTDIEISYAESYQKVEKDKVKHILLHNVYQISESQFICPIESYQNIGGYMGNGLLTYNPNTQRQLLKRKSGDRIVESINIDPKKVSEITESMLDGTFSPNAIIWNVRKINGQEKIKYDLKNKTLLIEPDNITTFCDICDGMHRTGGMLKTVEAKPEIDRVTSIYIHHVTEERANQIIRQESKQTPISYEFLDFKDTTNQNMEVAKAINSRQRKNEMFNRIGLDSKEIRIENYKLTTFETVAKAIEFTYDLNDKNKPIILAEKVEDDLIELFNYIIGFNHEKFKVDLEDTKEKTYMATDNMFMIYIIIGDLLRQKYNDDWKEELFTLFKILDFNKSNEIWKKIGIENNVNLSTYKKMRRYFEGVILEKEVS